MAAEPTSTKMADSSTTTTTTTTTNTLEVLDAPYLDFEIDPQKGQEKLREFGYYYTKDGRCRDIKENKPVGRLPSQEVYERFGETVENFIFYVIEHYVQMIRIDLPQIPKQSLAPGIIFTTREYEQKETLLFIIPGSGAVRASQWARSICINDSLADGTCIPFVQSARKRNWGVLLCDPNARLLKTEKDKGRVFPIEHCQYVFQKYVVDVIKGKKSPIKNIFIVAHSVGGWCTSELLEKHSKWLEEKNLIKGIAFTDCGDPGNWIANESRQVYQRCGQNWVTSKLPLDTPLSSSNLIMRRVSAGHQQHEWTSASAYQSIFKFFDRNIGLKYKYLPIPSKTTEEATKSGNTNEKKEATGKANTETEMKQESEKPPVVRENTEEEIKNITTSINDKMHVTTDETKKEGPKEAECEKSEQPSDHKHNVDVEMEDRQKTEPEVKDTPTEQG